MKRFASGVTPSELLPHIDEMMTMSTIKQRHNKITSLSRKLNEVLVDDENF